MQNELVIVLDFGGQYKELIARRIRECHVLSRILPGTTPVEKLKEMNPIGIVLTGGPQSVYLPQSPRCDRSLFELGIPVWGICYGAQLLCHVMGGEVSPCAQSEYGVTSTVLDTATGLFKGLDAQQSVLMSHTDQISRLPQGFIGAAHTSSCPYAAVFNEEKRLYGTQFHPEVINTKRGKQMFKNFLLDICHAKGDYTMRGVEKELIESIRAQVGDGQVVLGLSGGVDSSVCAALLAKAIPGQAFCIFVDHGMMRKDEGDQIEAVFASGALQFIRVNAQERFLGKLKGVTDPETKRKIIGEEFVRVFEEESEKLRGAEFLAQGTIYPDVVESGANKSATIKSHHNVGGLPKDIRFKGLVEPLRGLFKDEVRILGKRLGLPAFLVNRQPFPGPGLAVRCIGEITKEKLDLLREADAIFREELECSRVKASQYFAVLTDTRSVGVMGDFRTYGYTVALRSVNTTDFMTCEYTKIPHSVLGRTAERIVNEVRGVSRVVYDITGKPPATVEWE